MNKIIVDIRKELKKSTNPKTKESFNRFFKEPVKAYGVSSGVVSRIGKRYWQELVKDLSKKEIFFLCEELLKSDYCEEAFIVCNWCPRLTVSFEKKDMKIFKIWINKYINNWAKCDSFCNHTIGSLILKYPELVKELKVWAKSKNQWMKRASAVSLVVPARKGLFLKEIFEISDILLLDKQDMVQKGYGWVLKEASKKNEKKVFDYVFKNKEVMPRTALRYAIELMPKPLKEKAMKKGSRI